MKNDRGFIYKQNWNIVERPLAPEKGKDTDHNCWGEGRKPKKRQTILAIKYTKISLAH